jgi:hypothetical protein
VLFVSEQGDVVVDPEMLATASGYTPPQAPITAIDDNPRMVVVDAVLMPDN